MAILTSAGITFGDATTQTTAATAPFVAGTAMMFVQTAAPTGWTKSTTHDNKALRVVSGTASSGGSSAFSTVFSNQTPTITTSGLSAGATTLTTAQMPSHNHYAPPAWDVSGGVGNSFFPYGTGPATASNRFVASGESTAGQIPVSSSTGGGGSHTHTVSGSATSSAITLAVQYVDVIIATKN